MGKGSVDGSEDYCVEGVTRSTHALTKPLPGGVGGRGGPRAPDDTTDKQRILKDDSQEKARNLKDEVQEMKDDFQDPGRILKDDVQATRSGRSSTPHPACRETTMLKDETQATENERSSTPYPACRETTTGEHDDDGDNDETEDGGNYERHSRKSHKRMVNRAQHQRRWEETRIRKTRFVTNECKCCAGGVGRP